MNYGFTRTGPEIEAIHNTVTDPSTNQGFTDAIGEKNSARYSELSFENITNLKNQITNGGAVVNLSSYPEGTKISWMGYYSRSDGGSNWGRLRFGAHVEDGGSIFSIDANTYIESNLKGNRMSVLKWGVRNDYDPDTDTGDNSQTQLASAVAYRDRGILVIPEGDYKIDTLTIANKNAGNDNRQSRFGIEATGATLWSTATGTSHGLVINQTKRLDITGLRMESVTGATPTWLTSLQGCWFSRFEDCYFGSTAIGVQDSGGFNSYYYLDFEGCTMLPLGFGTGDNIERHVIQVINFKTCFISARNFGTANPIGPYAIEIYGSRSINTTRFDTCDISYYGTQGLYIDDVADGNIDFDNCYFDTDNMFPLDTSNLFINTYGAIQTPSSGNTNSFLLENGSYVRTSANVGTNFGRREPLSNYNLIKNGSCRAPGDAGLSVGFFTLNDVLNNEGYFRSFKDFISTGDSAFVDFNSIPVPFGGYYTLTVIAKVSSGVLGTRTGTSDGDTFGTLNIGSDWTITSLTKRMDAGDTFEQSFFNDGSPGQGLRINIAYVGLTYGSVGNIGAIEHPDANFFSALEIANGFETISLKPRGATGLPNSTLFEDTNNGLSYKDKNGVVRVIAYV